ncbi:glutamine amido transferase [Streptococcus infantarius subsp. infantarius]|nr:glutamine amido transferase [Streptococcus infantarius subsp. infantarius]
MPKPLIGISANEKSISNDIPIVHLSSSRNFADGVRKAGGLPVYLPVSSEVEAEDYINAIDALILTGGQDIDPRFYG